MEVRAGTKNDNTNEIVGTFKGPGVTGAKHVVQLTKPVFADFLTFQLKKKGGILQISGIYLNEMSTLGKKDYFLQLCKEKIQSYTFLHGTRLLSL